MIRFRRLLRGRQDQGAAAVEFAVILPVLLLIVFGIIEFGFVFNTQIALTQAAREGVRYEALGTGTAEAEAESAFIALQGQTATATLLEGCDNGDRARLEISSNYSFFFLPFGDRTLSGEAVMRCGG